MYAQRVAIAEGGQQRERKLSTFRIGFALIIRLTFTRWTGAVYKASGDKHGETRGSRHATCVLRVSHGKTV